MKTLNILLFFLFIFGTGNAQLIAVTGCVSSSENGDAVVNASVFEVKSGIGTITNNFGNYKLVLKSGMQEIQFSEPGFESRKLNLVIEADTTLNIQLTPLEQKSRGKNNHIHASPENIDENLHSHKLLCK